jgi:hypothetical protein
MPRGPCQCPGDFAAVPRCGFGWSSVLPSHWLAAVGSIGWTKSRPFWQARPWSCPIIDGQTLEVAVQDEARKATRVRLLGIRVVDGASAHQWLASNLVHQTVRIKLDKRRRATDGAHLAYVYLGPIFVNAEMISRGWARHEPYPGDSARHASLMREATGK